MPWPYTDIFIRDNFGDSGAAPSTGIPYLSPDIVPLQDGTWTVAQAIATYAGPDQGQAIVNGGANNVYVRAKNLQPAGTETGSVQLYYSYASLLMLPTQWLQNTVATASGETSVPFVNQSGSQNLAPNDIALGNPAFLLTGLPPAENDHYCFVAVVTTPNTTVDVPQSFSSNAAFVSWVQNHPAVAFRNLTIVPSSQTQIVRTTTFGSTNANPAYFHFRILAKNFPVGSTVTAVCSDQRCPIRWTGSLPAPDSQGNQITGFDWNVPGNFTGGLVTTIAAPQGQSFQPGAQLEITYYQYPQTEAALDGATSELHQLERSVARVVPIVRDHSRDGVARAAFAAMLIQLGQVTFLVR